MNENLTAKQKFENLFSKLRGEKEQETSNIGLYELHTMPSSKQWYLKFVNIPGNVFLPGRLKEQQIIDCINANPGKDQFQIREALQEKYGQLFRSEFGYGFNLLKNGKNNPLLVWCNSNNKCGAIQPGYENLVMDYLDSNPELKSRFAKGEINSKQLSSIINSYFNKAVIRTRKSNGEYFHVKASNKVERQDTLKIREKEQEHQTDNLVYNPLMKPLIQNKEDAELAVAKKYLEEIRSLKCPRCGEQLRLCINRGSKVTRNRGEIFFGCSNYAKNSRSDCRYTLPITGLVYVLHRDMIDEFIYKNADSKAHLPLDIIYYRKYVKMYHKIFAGRR